MSNEIKLNFDKTITKLAGNELGKHTYNNQVKDKINYTDNEIILIFPERIDLIASSFIQGFFEEIIRNIGISGVENKVVIKSSIEEIKNKIIQNLLWFVGGLHLEIAALVVSILAVIITIINFLFQQKRETKFFRKNLDAEYFNEIYKDSFIFKIPTSRRYISFTTEGNLVGVEKLIEELTNVRAHSIYYHYNDFDYYSSLKEQVESIEDFLVLTAQKTLHGEDQNDFFNKLNTKIKKLYEINYKKYIGK